ncbi:hypothetical protein [Comamonas thiooxydans]|uniref:hypothetical protein n=1 Tax=Comamonas thiooxydans TaxID=363952 RepID=UPI0013DCE52F|nr:hypothetical protein [Comamonas thiooxydans]
MKEFPKIRVFEVPVTNGHGTEMLKVAASSGAAAVLAIPFDPNVKVGRAKSIGWQPVAVSVDGSFEPTFHVGTGRDEFKVVQGDASFDYLSSHQPAALKVVNDIRDEHSAPLPDEY